jgi:hypothetical protein
VGERRKIGRKCKRERGGGGGGGGEKEDFVFVKLISRSLKV